MNITLYMVGSIVLTLESLMNYKKVLQGLLDLYKAEKEKNKELEDYKHYAELTKISCCVAQNCEALNNAIRLGSENEKLKEKNNSLTKQINLMRSINLPKEIEKEYISKGKIKSKIEELQKEQAKYINSQEWELEDSTVYALHILAELLEEE